MAHKRFRIRYKRLIIFIVCVLIFVFFLLELFSIRITNIYVNGNYYLSDQEIIEMGNLQNYPRALFVFSNSLESGIGKNQYVSSVHVNKKGFTKIYIDVVENRPLFYDEKSNKTILKDGSSVSELFNIPTLVNSVDSSIYDSFLNQLSLIDFVVFNNISEIEYSPNEVDNELFLFTMNDGNYIYANLDKFVNINKYFDMIVNFNNHKGILYLDSGEYFKILDN